MITWIKNWWAGVQRRHRVEIEFWGEMETANVFGRRGVVNNTLLRVWDRLDRSHMNRDVELDTYVARLVNLLVCSAVPQLTAGDAVLGVVWHGMQCGIHPRDAVLGVIDPLSYEGARGGTVPVRADSLRQLCQWLPGIRSGIGLQVQQFPSFLTIVAWLAQEGRQE